MKIFRCYSCSYDRSVGLMHTLFTLEDTRGLKIGKLDSELCLRLDKDTGMTYHSMWDMFNTWYQQAEKLESGEITKEQYDQWRYTYPKMEAEQTRRELDALREKRKAENNTDKKSQQKGSYQIDFTQFSKTFSISFS